MAKPIPEAIKQEFLAFVRERHADGGEFSLQCFERFEEEDEDGNPLWEFHARNHDPDDTHDIFELLGSVQPAFTIEQHGYDDFVIVAAGE